MTGRRPVPVDSKTVPFGSSLWDTPGSESRTHDVTASPRMTPGARAVLERQALDPAARAALASVPVQPKGKTR